MEIDRLIENLSDRVPKEVQNRAIKELIKNIGEDNAYKLILPYDKTYWGNAAEILQQIGCPANEKTVPGLLEWLKDMNWPGADIARKILEGFEMELIIPYIEQALHKAYKEKDYIWIAWIKDFIRRKKITKIDFHDKKAYELLELAEW